MIFFLMIGAGMCASQGEAVITEIEPRIWSCDFQSRALGKPMRFLVILPEGAAGSSKKPVIYFLHGRGRNERSLLESPVAKKRMLESRYAIVLPRGEDGWYINSPVKKTDLYADYTDEVIALAESKFPISSESAHRGIVGWSMGGYGASMTAIRRAGDFKALASIIGLLDFPRAPISEPGQNYEVPIGRFGTRPEVWKDFNPRLQVGRLKDTKVFLAIGEDAFDRQMNDAFLSAATGAGVACESVRLPGKHAFLTVEEAVSPALDFFEKTIW